VAVCGRCGEENPARARFCLACGNGLERESSEARKIISVLFADVVGSTGLGEGLDPEALRILMTTFFTRAEAAIQAHGGTVEKFIGDAVMAVFGIPQAHEDDALRAVRAAVDIQKEVARINDERSDAPISVRIGINSGEVLAQSAGSGRTGVVGDAVNSAARLEKLAPPGGIVIGAPTHRLVRGSVTSEALGSVEIKGRNEPLDAHLILAVESPGTQSRNFEAPMVGRKRELDALEREYERVAEDRICVLFTVLGPAGIGKSRLIAELTETALQAPRVLSGRCLPYGDGITFWPITETISEAAHISDRDSQEEAMLKLLGLLEGAEDAKVIANLVAQLIGLADQTASQEETFWAVRKVFEIIASSGPLVLIFDDIHWAEPTFLDLIDHIIDLSEDAPLLVACLARPELLESRPAWAGGKLNSTTMLLEPLREAESKELFTGLLGDTTEIDPLLPRILEVSAGNPFFLEETVSMLVEEKAIENIDGRWVAHADVDAISLPPTINALLTARLDQLPSEERITIEHAAVMGKVFATEAVRELAGDEGGKSETFEVLSRKGLMKIDQEEFAGEEMYRFRHILIRDAAYQGIPKERRAEIHERYADWLIEVLGDRSAEYEEIIAYHLDQSIRYREELGGVIIASSRHKASRYLASAGRRALARGDCASAITLLGPAFELDQEGNDPLLPIDLSEGMTDIGQYSDAKRVLAQVIEGSEDVQARELARLHLENLLLETEPNRSLAPAHQIVERAIESLSNTTAHVGLSFAYRLRAYLHDTAGRSSASQNDLKMAILHASKAGDERRVSAYSRFYIGSLSWGPINLSELRKEIIPFLEAATATGDLLSKARALSILGMAEACQGEIESGRQRISEAQAIYDKFGLVVRKAWSCFEAVAVEMSAGDLGEAEAILREAVRVLEDHNERSVLPTLLAILAHVRLTQGDLDETRSLTDRADTLAANDDVLTQIKLHSIQARVSALDGNMEKAEDQARSAITLAEGTEYLDWTADAWMDLAEVRKIRGLDSAAAEAAQVAFDLYKVKGMSLAAERASQFLH
jgi:class 3 adenylate cyclase/tetratricopeptide (TPR) repeat protein